MIMVVAALISRNGEILLIEQQGSSDAMSYWSVPGGVVEDGEALSDALRREVYEETGIEVTALGPLAYIVNYKRHDDKASIVFTFTVEQWHGAPKPDDPDGLIIDCRFFPLTEAIRLVEGIPYPVMREPLLAYLNGDAKPGTLWEYS